MSLRPDSIGGNPVLPEAAIAEQMARGGSPPPGGISTGMVSIEASLGALEQAVTELCDRLHSVQKPESPSTEANEVLPAEPVRSEHAVYLFQVDGRLRAITEKVVTNNQRLDI